MPAVFQDVAGIALKMAVYPFKQYFNRDPKACFPNFELILITNAIAGIRFPDS